jgi:hypothetical protein
MDRFQYTSAAPWKPVCATTMSGHRSPGPTVTLSGEYRMTYRGSITATYRRVVGMASAFHTCPQQRGSPQKQPSGETFD